MRFPRFTSHVPHQDRPTVVTFTGGMGAQIISAAIFFSMRNAGRQVFADLSYFNKPEHVAVAGTPGDCSQWGWQLEPFRLFPESFATSPRFQDRRLSILKDGPEKIALALEALEQPEIQKIFEIPLGLSDVLPADFAGTFLCIHLRRGDYVNVASHVVADGPFISLARKLSGLVNRVVVISDSSITANLRSSVSACFSNAAFLDDTDPYTAHRIMRNARVLICSNSQFSLSAAALNSAALAVIPKQWVGAGERHIETPIHAKCLFEIFGNSEP
jgi:Glycosyl transferase family 11